MAPRIRVADTVRLDDLVPEVMDRTDLRPCLDRLEGLSRRVDRTALRLGFSRIQLGQLVRYEPGGHYRWHRDAAVTRFRKVSALLYLSDAGSHGLTGGETLFAPHRYRKRWRPISIAPECGTALVFDSRIWHRAVPTTAGTKYVLLMMFA
jgi:hypothetical protein